MEEILEEWKVDIISPETGLVSFKLDGLEDQLNPDVIDLLTPERTYLLLSIKLLSILIAKPWLVYPCLR